VLCAILLLILLMGMVIFIYYKLTHYKRGRKFSPAWLISSSDITAFRNQTDCVSATNISVDFYQDGYTVYAFNFIHLILELLKQSFEINNQLNKWCI